MNVKVSQEKCIGCGSCQAICNEVFDIQDDGLAHVINDNIDESLFEDVKDAASNCPTDAIDVDE